MAGKPDGKNQIRARKQLIKKSALKRIFFIFKYQDYYFSNCFSVFIIIETQFSNCSSFITKGGANLMILPCVGLASKPLSRKAIQMSQAVELSSVSLITMALSNPFPLTNVAIVECWMYSPIFVLKIFPR